MGTIVKGKNDLYTWCVENNRSDILEEWSVSLNNGLTPHEIAHSTNKIYFWTCPKCKNNWEANPNSRTRKNGTSCPYCSGKVAIKGKTDFATLFPLIAQEWNYERNDKNPDEYTPFSAKKVWWKGKCNHEWQDSIAHRTSRNSNCPICFNQIRTSFPEQAIFYYVKQYFPDAINNERTLLNGKELDIYIPSINTAIEYDGQAWHEDRKKDEQKNKLCEEKQIILYRIRERACWFWPETPYLKLISCLSRDINDLNEAIRSLLFSLGFIFEFDVDISRDEIAIREQFTKRIEAESLAVLYPDLAKEWHPTRNGTLTPDMITKKSTAMIWWIDSLGHEWQAKVHSRTNGAGCPYCSQPAKKLLSGFNDFETKNPEIAVEWNYSKNKVPPSQVLFGSAKKYWWTCPICGNDYLASPAHRHRGTGCPKCGFEKTRVSKYKKIKNLDTGETFSSLKEACNKYGLKNGNLSKCCNGKRKTCGGYRWEYIE